MMTATQMREKVLYSGQQAWIATDVLRLTGVRNPTSRSRGYRLALYVLKGLEREEFLTSRYFPSVNLTVFWKIP